MELYEKSLRYLTTNRMIDDLIENSLQLAQDSFTLIIVDSYSAKLLSNYLTMTDILNKGIFSVESIYNTRQNFPNYNAIYFISPTENSINLLKKDFLNKPKYKQILIYFTHKIEENIFNLLIINNIIKRTILCKELNLSFFIKENNVFDFNFESGLKIFTLDDINKENLIKSISYRLFSVCSTLKFFPYIQYQNNSKLCCRLCEILENLLQEFGRTKNLQRNGILLLTDRTYDPMTPLLHDYVYEPLVYDIFSDKINKNDEIDVNFENEAQNNNIINTNSNENKKVKKILKLSDKYELWNSYKLLHFAHVLEKISEDIENFQASDLSKVKKKNDSANLDDMANIITKMSSYKLKNAEISNNYYLAKELKELISKNFIKEIIKLEQQIVTGESENNVKIKERDLFKNFTILKAKLQNNREELIRLLLILYTNLLIPENDFNHLSGKLELNEDLIFKNLTFLGVNKFDGNKIDRRKNVLLKREKNNNNLIINDSDAKFVGLSSNPKFEILIEKASNFELDLNEFPFKNWSKEFFPKIQKKGGTKGLFGGKNDDLNENDDLGKLLFFNIGGLSRNEITSIQKLEKNNLVNHKIIIGSTQLYTAKEYIKNIRDIQNNYSKELGNDIINDNMDAKIGNNNDSNRSNDNLINENDIGLNLL
jgi:hypothetical protein